MDGLEGVEAKLQHALAAGEIGQLQLQFVQSGGDQAHLELG